MRQEELFMTNFREAEVPQHAIDALRAEQQELDSQLPHS